MADNIPSAGDDRTMVIVGGGECGARAAFALRSNGWTGRISVVGREAVHAYERPPLSKAALVDDAWEPVHPYRREQFAQQAGIDLQLGVEVVELDTTDHALTMADGATLRYHKLLLAVGAQPRRLPYADDVGLLYLRTVEDAVRLRKRLVPGSSVGIIGAGFIGLELAASARCRDVHVHVIEAADRALARAVPAPVAADLIAVHEDHGVEFRWATAVTAIVNDGDGIQVSLDSGERLRFDAVAVGIGAAPEVRLAQAAGLTVDNGIAVDEFLRTSASDVFAAGDCASFPHPLFDNARIRLEAWRNAHDQADTAAANMLGGEQPHRSVPWFWSDQFDHTLQVAGLSSAATTWAIRNRDDGVTLHFGLNDANHVVCVAGLGRGNAVARDVRLAERLIAQATPLRAQELTDPTTPLKQLLASGTGAA